MLRLLSRLARLRDPLLCQIRFVVLAAFVCSGIATYARSPSHHPARCFTALIAVTSIAVHGVGYTLTRYGGARPLNCIPTPLGSGFVVCLRLHGFLRLKMPFLVLQTIPALFDPSSPGEPQHPCLFLPLDVIVLQTAVLVRR